MPDAVDSPYEDDSGPELGPTHDTDVPNLEQLQGGVSGGDHRGKLESEDPADEGFGRPYDAESDGPGYRLSGEDLAELDFYFDQAETGEEELPSRDEVVDRARDLLAKLDSAADDGDTSEALPADAREAVRRYATTEAVEFLRSVDSPVFRKAPEVTDADVEVVVKALRDAVQKVGLEEVLAIVAQLARDRETLKTLLLITDTSSAPSRVKNLVKRFSLRGSLFAGAALVCAAGVKIGLMGDPSAEAVLGNETAIAALIAAVAALFKRPR